MPVYEYECAKGHKSERVVQVSPDEPKGWQPCPKMCYVKSDRTIKQCGLVAELIPSHTGKPKFKAGIGGFYAPTSQ